MRWYGRSGSCMCVWRRWVPKQERSRSLALVYSGMYTGSILGLGLSPHMVASLGWSSVFYIFGTLGIAWFVFWVQVGCRALTAVQFLPCGALSNTVGKCQVSDITSALPSAERQQWAAGGRFRIRGGVGVHRRQHLRSGVALCDLHCRAI